MNKLDRECPPQWHLNWMRVSQEDNRRLASRLAREARFTSFALARQGMRFGWIGKGILRAATYWYYDA
jgi:hypothetical protein